MTEERKFETPRAPRRSGYSNTAGSARSANVARYARGRSSEQPERLGVLGVSNSCSISIPKNLHFEIRSSMFVLATVLDRKRLTRPFREGHFGVRGGTPFDPSSAITCDGNVMAA
ncbi:MAG: hypothetical protein ABL996_03400 [Micropepsaceae bacterium]